MMAMTTRSSIKVKRVGPEKREEKHGPIGFEHFHIISGLRHSPQNLFHCNSILRPPQDGSELG